MQFTIYHLPSHQSSHLPSHHILPSYLISQFTIFQIEYGKLASTITSRHNHDMVDGETNDMVDGETNDMVDCETDDMVDCETDQKEEEEEEESSTISPSSSLYRQSSLLKVRPFFQLGL